MRIPTFLADTKAVILEIDAGTARELDRALHERLAQRHRALAQ